MLDQEFLDILVCPKCHGSLDYDSERQTLTCWSCRLRYAIDDGIPVMLVDQATAVPEDEAPAKK